jgi:hypothetical protein
MGVTCCPPTGSYPASANRQPASPSSGISSTSSQCAEISDIHRLSTRDGCAEPRTCATWTLSVPAGAAEHRVGAHADGRQATVGGGECQEAVSSYGRSAHLGVLRPGAVVVRMRDRVKDSADSRLQDAGGKSTMHQSDIAVSGVDVGSRNSQGTESTNSRNDSEHHQAGLSGNPWEGLRQGDRND